MSEQSGIPAPVAALFPPTGESSLTDDWLTQHIAAALGRVAQGSVTPTIDMPTFRAALAQIDFNAPLHAHDLLTWTISQLETGTVHMTHPRYFGLFNPAPAAPAQWADRIAGAFNPQLASSGSSPVPIEIEAHVIRAVARRAGMPDETGGHFTISGSEANATALICALTRANPRFGDEGTRAFSGPIALYASADCHPAWTKIAHQVGVGRHALRLIATDGTGILDPRALDSALAADTAAGVIPVLIVATAGTTGGGMVDPLSACADIAAANGIWLHVDAAWGGAALSSRRLRGVLNGIERADSATIDAHKWFAATMGCGMFLTRHYAVLSEAFRVTAEFMPSNAAARDPYLNTAQWSRRFIGLRVFLMLGIAGWEGIARHVERAVIVIKEVESRLVARGWTVANNSSLAVLCVVPPSNGSRIADIVRRTLDSGRAWVARSSFEGREVIRICATHGQTSLADVDDLVNALASEV